MTDNQYEEVEITPKLLKIRSGQFTLSSITTLNLSQLGIRTLTNDLKECRYLKRLYLNYNNIQEITNLDGLSHLEYLDLSHNKISKLPSNSFEGLKKLSTLLMEGNQIQSLIELESLSLLPSLRSVNFLDNPISKDLKYDEKLKIHVKQLTIIDGEHIALRIPNVEWNDSKNLYELVEKRPWDQDDSKNSIFSTQTEGAFATQFGQLLNDFKNSTRECQRLIARADSLLEA